MKTVKELDWNETYLFLAQAQGDNFINKMIKEITQTWGEGKTETGHAGLIVDNLIIEQTFPKQGTASVSKYPKMFIYRRLGLTSKQKRIIRKLAVDDIDKRYGVINILLFLISALFWKVVTLPFYILHCGLNLFRRNKRKWNGLELSLLQFLLPHTSLVCSQMVARCFSKVGIHIGSHWLSTTPDGIHDYCRKHPEQWERIILKK